MQKPYLRKVFLNLVFLWIFCAPVFFITHRTKQTKTKLISFQHLKIFLYYLNKKVQAVQLNIEIRKLI